MEPARTVHFGGSDAEEQEEDMHSSAALRRRANSQVRRRTSLVSIVTLQEGLSRAVTIAKSEKTDRHVAWLANFHFAVAMAFLVKGMAAACLDFAPFILPANNIVQVGSCVLWLALAFGCVFGATPVVSRLGAKRAVFSGMLLFDTFYLLFMFCAMVGPGSAQWVLFIAGMFCVGIGGSILLTAICIYMTKIAAVLAEESPMETVAEMTAHLGGTMGMWSLGTEVLFKLATAALSKFSMPYWTVIALWSVLALVCSALFLLVREPPDNISEENSDSEMSTASDLRTFFSLWLDPKLWMIGLLNFTAAFSDALVENFINPKYVAPMLGSSSIGLAMAMVSVVGVFLAKPYSFLGAYAGNGLVIGIAALSYAAIPLAILFSSLATTGGWWVLMLYMAFGSGRAVHEGLNRSMFAEFFPGRLVDPAYANFNFQLAIVEATCNLAQTMVSQDFLLYTSLALAAVTTPAYLVAAHLRERGLAKESEDQDGVSSAASGSERSSPASRQPEV